MTYELVRKYLTPEGDKNPSAVRKLAAGAISGAVAQTCTYPLYVIIVCLQLPNDVDRI
jgi:solute carrier family 25 (mitochondrial phosphate transporter), member 23/24/25/41